MFSSLESNNAYVAVECRADRLEMIQKAPQENVNFDKVVETFLVFPIKPTGMLVGFSLDTLVIYSQRFTIKLAFRELASEQAALLWIPLKFVQFEA